MIISVLMIGLLLCTIGTASAHFTMVFPGDSENDAWDVTPEDYIAELGEIKTVYIMWGHPYEHISFDMTSVPEASLIKPDGTIEQLTIEETAVSGQDEEGNAATFTAYKASFTIDQMGDSIVLVKYDDADEGLTDHVKTVFSCGEEMWDGWDAEVATQQTEIIPYVRPYGMEESFVFSGNARYNGEILPDATVEVEKYHTLDVGKEVVEAAEEKFPYDAPMVFTRVVNTNEQGDFSYTLDEPGIWFVCATKEVEDGHDIRGVFIVPVLEAFPAPQGYSAELMEAVEEAKQIAQDAKQTAESSESSPSTPGFEAIIAVFGLLAAVLIAARRE